MTLVSTGEEAFRSHRNPVFVIAEIGGNHEGDLAYARRLTQLAIESGADAVKYQIYEGDRLVSPVESRERNEHFKRFELGRQGYTTLAEMCRASGVKFMASVWDGANLAWADELIEIHKVGSGDFTAYPILKRLVASGKPLILSTGLCTYDDIEATLRYVSSLDRRYIEERRVALLQCTTAYPCPPEEANLNVLAELRRRFPVTVGYSNHVVGVDAALAAVTMGAEIVELHFTDTRDDKTFRDHALSVTRDEMRAWIAACRRVRVLQGVADKGPTPGETAAGHVTSFRRSVYAVRPIEAGELLSEDNLTVLRPAVGIPASEHDSLIGRRAVRRIERFEVLRREDVAGA